MCFYVCVMMRVFCNADLSDEKQYYYYDYWHLTPLCVCVCVWVYWWCAKEGQKVVRGSLVPRTRDNPLRCCAALVALCG